MNQSYVDTLVVKIASRCNLNCSYCYMYNKGDMSYLKQPKFMSTEITDALIDRVVEHCEEHSLKTFSIVLHGGEPLLMGIDRLKLFVESFLERGKQTGIEFVFALQTNGLLVSREWCEFFNEYEINVGISIDGDKETNDKLRVGHKGEGSYDSIVKAIEICSENYNNSIALLSVININADPVQTLDHFIQLGAERVDFLFPDNNYEDLPEQPLSGKYSETVTPYGDWLSDAYDYWDSLDPSKKPIIRLFHNLIYKFCGITIASDMMGQEKNHVLVIETNGDIEPVDSLKICGDNFTKTDMNVVNSSLNDAFDVELARLYHDSSQHLSESCLNCSILDFCGGGFIAHRYSKDNGFMNPTVYCRDYIRLISHVQSKLVNDLSDELKSMNEVTAISYDEIVRDLNIQSKTFY